MKIFLMFLVLVLIVVWYGYPIARATKMNKNMHTQVVPYEQHPVETSMRVLVAGDSTGVGTGAVDSRDSIAGRLGADFPNADIENISENGLKLEDIKQKLEAQGEKTYDLLVLQIGANDIMGLTSLTDIREQLDAILTYAEAHATKTIVITAGNIGLATVFRFPLSKLVSLRTREVRSIFQFEIDERAAVHYVDLFEEKEDDVFGTDIEKYYAPDRFHPSGAGYGVWYESVKKMLR